MEALARTITRLQQQVSKILFCSLHAFILLSSSQSEFSSLRESNSDTGARLGFGQPPQSTGFGSSSNNAGGGLFGGTTPGFGTGGKSHSSVPFQTLRMIYCRVALLFLRPKV